MLEIFKRVEKWYEIRKDKVPDQDLQHSLLCEEYHEWLQATKPVDECKELADIIFVAMGGIWSLSVSNDENSEVSDVVQDRCEANAPVELVPPGYSIGAVIDVLGTLAGVSVIQLYHLIITLALAQMIRYGHSQDTIRSMLLAVCDSNDSKSLDRIPTGEKYGPEGKGLHFQPAEPAIRKILEATCPSIIH